LEAADAHESEKKRVVIEKVLGRMEALKGFIQIPAKNRKEVIGDMPPPFKTILNGETARLDSYGRLWSSSLQGRFSSGNKIKLIRIAEGFEIEPVADSDKETFLNTQRKNGQVIETLNTEETKKIRNRHHKGGTETSSFGSPGRFGHNSSKFYNSRLYEGIPSEKKVVIYLENEISNEFLDRILCKSSESMNELPENSVHLMVTSPPYNVGKEYDKGLTLDEYKELLKNVFKEVYRALVPGGRVCVNIANLGRKPYVPLNAFLTQIMLDIGFLMRGEIIWDKGSSAAASTAWGSWCSASNPTLRDVHEYIMVFSKDTFKRPKPHERKNTITREEFLEWTKSVWSFPAESATRVGHPAPFPTELPLRCVKLYTFEGEVVLDPFIGSGTTAIACLRTNRHYIGYDVEKQYVDIANRRIQHELRQIKTQKEQAKLERFTPIEHSF
jgi:site-specific DNA-methyltransferase (adenine-specific)